MALELGEESASAPATLYPWERPTTHYTEDWVGPRVGLDRRGKSRLHWDSIPGPSSPQPVAIPTMLPGPLLVVTTVLVPPFLLQIVLCGAPTYIQPYLQNMPNFL
jgi:hypothetical protein